MLGGKYQNWITPPGPEYHVYRALYLVVGALPLLGSVFWPFPGADTELWLLRLAAGVLVSLRLWLSARSLQPFTPMERVSMRICRTVGHGILIAVVFSPFGQWLASLWISVPVITGVGGGLVLAVITAIGWVNSDSGLSSTVPSKVRLLCSPVLLACAIARQAVLVYGTVPFFLVLFHPEPTLLSAAVVLVAVEAVLGYSNAFVTGLPLRRSIEALKFANWKEGTDRDYSLCLWIYDAIVARPGTPDFSFLVFVLEHANQAAQGKTRGWQRLVVRDPQLRNNRPNGRTSVFLTVAQRALELIEDEVIPYHPDEHVSVLRCAHDVINSGVLQIQFVIALGLFRYDEAIQLQKRSVELLNGAGAPQQAALAKSVLAYMMNDHVNQPEAGLLLVDEILVDPTANPIARRLAAVSKAYRIALQGDKAATKRAFAEADEIRVDRRALAPLRYEVGRYLGRPRLMLAKMLVDRTRENALNFERLTFDAIFDDKDTAFRGKPPVLTKEPVRLSAEGRRPPPPPVTVSGMQRRHRDAAEKAIRLAEQRGDLAGAEDQLSKLISAALARHDWGYYYENLLRGIELREAQRDRVLDPDTRMGFEAAYYAIAADVLAHLGEHTTEAYPLAKAFDLVERARSRVFLEQLGETMAAAPPPGLGRLIEAEERALVEYRVAQKAITDSSVSDHFLRQRTIKERLEKAWAALANAGPLADAYVAQRRGLTVTYGDIRDLLRDAWEAGGPRVVLMEYQVDPNGTKVFVGRSDYPQPMIIQLSSDDETVERLVNSAFGSMSAQSDPGEWPQELAELVAPAAEHSDEGDVLWLVPHSVLHQVPLHALPVNGRPLAERNPVCVTPSASVMRYCQSRSPGQRHRALVLADSRSDLPLVHARTEAATIANMLSAEAHIAHNATGELLRERLPTGEFDILHLACHGEFDRAAALNSGIALADTTFSARDFLSLRIDLDLVTLSACESGLSQRRPGDELIGLTRALLQAGASSVLVSLWAVDEISTSLLMKHFYTNLGVGKAAALRQAQKLLQGTTVRDAINYCEQSCGEGGFALRRDIANLRYRAGDFDAALWDYRELAEGASEDRRRELVRAMVRCRHAARVSSDVDYDLRPFDHPYYWAPFVLVGDWR